jgi:hypothetical protein
MGGRMSPARYVMDVILYFGIRGALRSGLPLCQIEIRIYDESRRNTISDALSDTMKA